MVTLPTPLFLMQKVSQLCAASMLHLAAKNEEEETKQPTICVVVSSTHRICLVLADNHAQYWSFCYLQVLELFEASSQPLNQQPLILKNQALHFTRS